MSEAGAGGLPAHGQASGPRRVLMTGDSIGGVWTFVLELVEALEPYGTEVLLASLGRRLTPAQRTAAARLRNLVIAEGEYKLEWMRDPWEDVAASGEWILGLADRFEPDVIHLNSFGHAALPFEAPVVLTAHSCVLSWWAANRGGRPPAEWDRYRDLVAHALESADVVTAPSQAMLACLAPRYGAVLPNAVVVPNARRAERFRKGHKEQLIFAAGRLWDEAKNIAALVRVAPHLKWRCAIAGERRHPNGSLAHFAGCDMLGPLGPDDIAGWYARASIYALPARYEPFGLSVLEAALSGCALVLGDIASLREVWGDAAVFVPPDDQNSLREALTDLIEDSERRKQLQARSGEVASGFTPEKLAHGYSEAYRVAMGSRRLACAS